MAVGTSKRCVSCGTPVTKKNGVWFPCPECGREDIVRCNQCRCQSASYVCPECGFKGP